MRAVAHDDLAAARAAHRVVGPTTACRHPHHVRAVVRRRGHQDVVAVGHHHGVRMPGQAAAQRALDVVDLTDPVQLIAGQVQQDDDRRVDRIGDVRHVHLVDFERGQGRVARTGERRDQPGIHVGALGVRGDGSDGGERRRRHPGGGRLAVRAGHDDGTPACAELAENRLVQRHRHQAADHRARAAARDPRRPARGGPGAERDSSTNRYSPVATLLPSGGDHRTAV